MEAYIADDGRVHLVGEKQEMEEVRMALAVARDGYASESDVIFGAEITLSIVLAAAEDRSRVDPLDH